MTVILRMEDETICRLARILMQEYADRRGISLRFSEEAEEAALLLCDAEASALPHVPTLRLGRKTGDLILPFPRESFFAAVEQVLHGSKTPSAPEVLLPNGAVCTLTAGEWAVFAALARGEGRTVKREELCAAEGSLNVLLHRLRGKLEQDGQKRFFSHRGEGYRLDCKGLLFDTSAIREE